MHHDAVVNSIRERMSNIRGQLDEDVDGIVDNAMQLADWRYYVKSFPWASVAMAAAVGYLAVPRRLEIVSPSADELAKLAKTNRLVVEHRPRGEEKPSILTTVGTLAANMVLRAGLAFAGQQAGKVFGHAAADDQPGFQKPGAKPW